MYEFTNNFELLYADATNDWNALDDDNYGNGGFLKPSQNNTDKHHTYIIDTDGAKGGSDDMFGQCTIDFDTRKESIVGVHFYSALTDSNHRTKKHWIIMRLGSNAINAYYNRNMTDHYGHVEETNMTHTVTGSDWRHVRMDIRRINAFTQVEARIRIWDNPSDFRNSPLCDHTITYASDHSHPFSSEIGLSSWFTDRASDDNVSEIDNVAVYRYDTSPDWFKPKGTLIMIQ